MSAYGIKSDFATMIKTSKDSIQISPNNQYKGTELNNDRFRKLYACYAGLLLEQYYENLKEEQKNEY